jgi:hypothetical protein
MKNIYVTTALVLLAITVVCSTIGLRHSQTTSAKVNVQPSTVVAGL